jgi:hypothetical protein
MQKRSVISLIIFALLSLIIGCAPLHGSVRPPFENVTVRLIQNGHIIKETQTDSLGSFRIENISDGKYGLLFVKDDKVYIYNDENTEGLWFVNDTVDLDVIEFLILNKTPMKIKFDFDKEKSDYLNRILKIDLTILPFKAHAFLNTEILGFYNYVEFVRFSDRRTVFEMIPAFEGSHLVSKARPFLTPFVRIDAIRPPKSFNYSNCIENKPNYEYTPGQIRITFVSDATKAEVEDLLSSYNLSTHAIAFPLSRQYRVDLLGDQTGFISFVQSKGFVHVPGRVFLVRSNSSIEYLDALDTFYSFPNATVHSLYLFDRIDGRVNVPKGMEWEWICELQRSNLVAGAYLDRIMHLSVHV